jgi:transcriptional adapter 2-alpha
MNKKDRTTPAEFAGWMPRRSEFEVEYLKDAEQIVSGIAFSDADETVAMLEQKLVSLRAYNDKLDERDIRTRFAVEWDLLDHEFRSFGGRNRREREMEEALLPLAQVVPRETLTNFVHVVESEMRLKEEIETYKKWRRHGIVNRDEGMFFSQLESLMSDDRVSPMAIDKWNRDLANHAESAEFRASLDKQLLSQTENQICQCFGLSPHGYLRIKDLLLREFEVRGRMNRELAMSFMPGHENVVTTIYDALRAQGLFFGMGDVESSADVEAAPDEEYQIGEQTDGQNEEVEEESRTEEQGQMEEESEEEEG